MRYDTSFYELLSRAKDEVLLRAEELKYLREDLARSQLNDTPNEEYVDALQDKIGEAYLALQYGQELFADLEATMDKVAIMTMFVEDKVSRQSFNLVYEEKFDR